MSATDIVQRYTEAFDKGDLATVENLLAPDFHFTGPLMSATSRDEFFQAMQGFDLKAKTVVQRVIADGSSVARVFDFQITSPVEKTIPMSEWIEVDDGKITAIRLFYDATQFPHG